MNEDKTRFRIPASALHGSDAEPTLFKPKPAKSTSTQDSSVSSSWGEPAFQLPGGGPVPSVGSVIKGRFVLEELIGRGGMGTVFKARDLRKVEAQDLSPFVAIKVLNEDFRRHPQSLQALQRESRKMQKLAHPDIVAVYDFDRDGGNVYIVMELLEGEPLDRLIRRAHGVGVGLKEALRITQGICRAIGYAHEQGIVHADLKPANIFLTREHAVKVLDFGIARAAKHSEDSFGDRAPFDPANLGALTPAYAGCEVIEGQKADARDDVYAIACVTYELITGLHPFDRLSAAQARDAALKPKPPRGLSKRQWGTLRRGLSLQRSQRPKSATEFFEGLQQHRRVPVIYAAVGGTGIAAAVIATILAREYIHKQRDVLAQRGALAQRDVLAARAQTPTAPSTPPLSKPTSPPPSSSIPPPPTPAAQLPVEALRTQITTALAQRPVSLSQVRTLANAAVDLTRQGNPDAGALILQLETGLAHTARELKARRGVDAAIRFTNEAYALLPESHELRDALAELRMSAAERLSKQHQASIATTQKKIESLLGSSQIDDAWIAAFDRRLQRLRTLLPASDPYLMQARSRAAALCLVEASALRGQQHLPEARHLLELSARYLPDSPDVAQEEELLAEAERDARASSLEQKLLERAQANDVAEALSELSELRSILPAGDRFLTRDGPSAIVAAYLRQAAALAQEGRFTVALDIVDKARTTAPSMAELAPVRARYSHYDALDQYLTSREHIDARRVRGELAGLLKQDRDEAAAASQGLIRNLMARINSTHDPRLSDSLLQTTKAIFGEDSVALASDRASAAASK